MERVELLTMLERAQGRRVGADVRAGIFTVRQLVDAVLAGDRHEAADADSGDGSARLPWTQLLAAAPDPAVEKNLAESKFLVALGCYALIRAILLLARLPLRIRASGLAHVPADGPFILSPNHQSHLDGFLLAGSLPFRTCRQLFFVGAAEYFDTPLMGRVARLLNIVPVDPDANLVGAMTAGAAGLRLKKALILFPEGERSIDGEVKRFRKGAAILSSHLDAPVVPVAIDGLFPLWPRGRSFQWRQLLPWRAAPVTITFGAPITVARGDYDAGTEALREAVVAIKNR
jgi:long-chain acyl-CoA synthetase